jgi:hypothetical protein
MTEERKIDDLWVGDGNPLDDPLWKQAEAEAEAEAEANVKRRPKRLERAKSATAFYYIPSKWADRAFAVLNSADQVKLAFRLYRSWKTRPEGSRTIVCSNYTLGIADKNRALRRAKAVMLHRLEAAGLIRCRVSEGKKSAHIRVVE